MQNYLDFREKINYEKIKEVAKCIKQGGIVIFPTETVYGIGVNGLNENAIKKLYEVKQRPEKKPISLLVNSLDMINEIAKDITTVEYTLIEKFFPGPLTIVLKKKDIVPNILTPGIDTVGIRMPENEIALKLIEYAGVPIATSSCNISGKPSATNLQEIMKVFEGKVDYFIDNGPSKIGLASTVVQIIGGEPKILRQGYITKDEIIKTLQQA